MTAAELKASILDQAIRGKLVPQDPADEPASELLKRIKAEKAKLIAAKKIKKEKPLAPITDDEKPFDIPERWEWVRLGEICDGFQYGTAEKSNKVGQVPVLRMGNLKAGEIVYDNLLYTSNLVDIETYSLQDGDLLFNRTNSAEQVGKVAIFRGDRPCIYAGYLVRFRPILCSSEYFNFLMGSSYQRDFCFTVKTDAIQQSNISASKFARFPIPLPPLAEQKRIVEKIEELMPLVERYGKAEERRAKLNAALPADLEKSILQEAICGRLTARWREEVKEEESAAELLKRIKAEKAKLIATKKIKKEKPLAPIADDEKPFDLPEGWEWCRLGDVATFYSGSTPSKDQIDASGDIPYFKVADMNRQENLSIMKFSEAYVKAGLNLPTFPCGAIVFPKNGGALLTNKRRVLGQESVCDLNTGGISTILPDIFEYFRVWFSTVDFAKLQSGSVIPTVSGKIINPLIIPLPPLAEQKAIVAKVEELLAQVRKLNAK